jgi:nitrogenase molybdenum-cofactor synthesis protein NifE
MSRWIKADFPDQAIPELGINVVMNGTQSGRREEYDTINDQVMMDRDYGHTNPTELERIIIEKEQISW